MEVVMLMAGESHVGAEAALQGLGRDGLSLPFLCGCVKAALVQHGERLPSRSKDSNWGQHPQGTNGRLDTKGEKRSKFSPSPKGRPLREMPIKPHLCPLNTQRLSCLTITASTLEQPSRLSLNGTS